MELTLENWRELDFDSWTKEGVEKILQLQRQATIAEKEKEFVATFTQLKEDRDISVIETAWIDKQISRHSPSEKTDAPYDEDAVACRCGAWDFKLHEKGNGCITPSEDTVKENV